MTLQESSISPASPSSGTQEPLERSNLPLPKQGQRAILVGFSGSGKTTLAQSIVSQFRYVVAMDPKGELRLKGATYHEGYRDLIADRKSTVKVYRPSIKEMGDTLTPNRLFWWIYLRKNTCLYIDEAYAYATSSYIPPGLLACITRGRSRGITCVISTQRPSLIPMVMLSEAEHGYVFRLRLDSDRKRMEATQGVKDAWQQTLPQYAFYHSLNGEVTGPYRLSVSQ